VRRAPGEPGLAVCGVGHVGSPLRPAARDRQDIGADRKGNPALSSGATTEGHAPATAARARAPRAFGLVFGLPMLIWQLAFFAAPLLFLVVMSFWVVVNFRVTPDFSLYNWAKLLSAGYFWDIYFRTCLYGFLAAALASLLAFPCAYFLAFRVSTNMRWLAVFLLITPFFTSYLVRTYTWKVILTGNGMVNAVFGFLGLGPFPMVNNLFGTMVGYLTLVLPLVILLQLFSLAYVDRNLVEAAHNLGCSALRTVFQIIIPSAKIGLVLAAAFAFILAFGDYVGPTLLGGSKPPTLSILILDVVKSGANWTEASVVAVMMAVTLLVVCFAALIFAYGRGGRRA
jgi:ABC-type spermidine/putrescine transport system permease subunit I